MAKGKGRAKRGVIPHEKLEPNLVTLSIPAIDLDDRVIECESKMIYPAIFFHRTSVATVFSLLPPELIFLIFSYLDMYSMIQLKGVNYSFKFMIETYLPYKSLVTIGRGALQALVLTKVLFKLAIGDLFDALKSKYCFSCGRAGQFFFIPTVKRCCRLCLQAAPELRLISLSAAKQCFGLDDNAALKLPIVLMPPGRFGIPIRDYKSSNWIVSLDEAHKAGLKMYGGEAGILRAVTPEFQRKQTEYQSKHHRWAFQLGTGYNPGPPPSRPRDREAKLKVSYVRSNYRVAVPLPFVNLREGTTELARYCKGCCYDKSRFQHNNSKHSPGYKELELEVSTRANTAWLASEFTEHVKVCPGVERLISGIP